MREPSSHIEVLCRATAPGLPFAAMAQAIQTREAGHRHGDRPQEARKPFLLDLYCTAVGKKYVMAITGIVLIGFVIAHMIGNLKMYLGARASSTTTASSSASCSCRSCPARCSCGSCGSG